MSRQVHRVDHRLVNRAHHLHPTPVPMLEGADAAPLVGHARAMRAAMDRFFVKRGLPVSEARYFNKPMGVRL